MTLLIAQASVQVRHHRVQLFLRHLICERGHRSLPCYQNLLNLRIRRRFAVRQCVPAEEAMQIWRNFFQVQIVRFVAVRAADVVQMLAFGLLWRERWCRPTTDDAGRYGSG